MKKTVKPFNVINWNPNSKNFEYYDVMPYFLNEFKQEKKSKYRVFCDGKEPKEFEDYKDFIKRASQYQFWSRCEYEIILMDWPCQKNTKKIDVHYQIMANIDIITEHFINAIQENDNKTK